MKLYVVKDVEVDIYAQLRDRDHCIMLDWINEDIMTPERFSVASMEGIRDSDLVIIYKNNDVEMGAALALHKEVYLIDGNDSIFTHHPLVTKFSSVAEVMSFLDTYELRKKLEWSVIRYEELKDVAIDSDKNARKKSKTMGRKVLKTEMDLRTMGWEAEIVREKVTYKRIGNSRKQESLI